MPRRMTRMVQFLSALLLALAFVPVAEAGPIVYFDIYRSLNVNGTLFENSTTGGWSATDPGPGFTRLHSSNIGQSVFAPAGYQYERIRATGALFAGATDDPENLSTYTDLFTSFVLDVPHTVNLDVFLSGRNDGYVEGFFYNETTQMMLAQAVVDEGIQRLRYDGVLEPGVYSYYLFARIIETGLFADSAAEFSGDLNLIPPPPVPEPATMTLLATGLVAAWRARRKSR
jgi:hypothetical protein